MTALQEKILDIFKTTKTPKNSSIRQQTLFGAIRKWDRRSQDDAMAVIDGLINDGYISNDGSYYILKEAGYNHIYRNYTITQTEDLIMSVFKKNNIGVGQSLMSNNFSKLEQDIDRFHFDNFNNAFQRLMVNEYIRTDGRFFILEQKGYDRIY